MVGEKRWKNKCEKKKPWKKITPLIKKCKKCGARVKNHHFLCDKCWGKKAKAKYRKKMKLEQLRKMPKSKKEKWYNQGLKL